MTEADIDRLAKPKFACSNIQCGLVQETGRGDCPACGVPLYVYWDAAAIEQLAAFAKLALATMNSAVELLQKGDGFHKEVIDNAFEYLNEVYSGRMHEVLRYTAKDDAADLLYEEEDTLHLYLLNYFTVIANAWRVANVGTTQSYVSPESDKGS